MSQEQGQPGKALGSDEFAIKSPSRVFRTPPKSEVFDWMEYITTEMFGVGEPGKFEPQVKEYVRSFLEVPVRLEYLMWLGIAMSLDAFLYVFTFLPIRIIFSCFLLLWHLQSKLCSVVFGFNPPPLLTHRGAEIRFHRTQAYDLMRGALVVCGCLVLKQINMSKVYHFIRGQSFIKLYVLTGMMEVMDKLLSSFGQDTFDALHWQTRYAPLSPKMMSFFAVALLYLCVHATLYFFVVATFTVVINSAEEALITVLVINNFSEIRSFVFKKFDGKNLFQLACSDINERFQILLFLFIIGMVTAAQAGDTWWEALWSFLPVAFLMVCVEIVADGTKHAFISKFNSIKADVYQDFAYVLRSDVLNNRRDSIILDHTYAVTRRLGISQLPLGCVFVRYVMLAWSAPAVAHRLQSISSSTLLTAAALLFVALVALKLVIGISLMHYSDFAQRKDSTFFIRSPVETVRSFPEVVRGQPASTVGSPFQVIKATAENEKQGIAADEQVAARIKFVEGLADMDRYTVYNGRII